MTHFYIVDVVFGTFHPPHMDDFYCDKETFCVVRNPMDRIMSQFRYIVADIKYRPHAYPKNQLKFECTSEHLNLYVKTALTNHDNKIINLIHDLKSNCHLLLQSRYISSSRFGGIGGKCGCKHIIRMENLKNDFARLTREFLGASLPMVLDHGRAHAPVEAASKNCFLGESNLTQSAKALIYEGYYPDFIALGYPVPPQFMPNSTTPQH